MSTAHSHDLRDGIWFTEWLLQNNLSDAEIASRLGVSTVTIWRWRRKRGQLRRSVLLAIDAIAPTGTETGTGTANDRG